MSNSKVFEPRIAVPLNESIVLSLAARNASGGGLLDAHIPESDVQSIMGDLLKVSLPSTELIDFNTQLLEDETLGRCIPDVVIKNIGSGLWGVFEIKTLFRDDQLSVDHVRRDLAKLCAYKRLHPHAAAVFVLVGSRSKLFNPQRASAWSELEIAYDRDSFVSPPVKQQALNAEFVAVPCGSCNIESLPVVSFMWEIHPRNTSLDARSSVYKFEATMA